MENLRLWKKYLIMLTLTIRCPIIPSESPAFCSLKYLDENDLKILQI